jgi:tetratricopeptide (TPR) repeat protein
MAEAIDVEAQIATGITLFADGRFDEAYGAILDVVEVAPRDARAWRLLGNVALRGARPLHAYQAYTRMREIEDDLDARLFQLAAAYYAADITASRSHAQEVASSHPDSSEAAAWVEKMDTIADERDLVVDVGRALCRQARFDEAIDYFADNSPLSMAAIESEVDRYIGMPGQALAYMIGRLEILELRAAAEAAMGPNFDIKGFHDTVLGSGMVPLETLGRMVRVWSGAA